MSDTIPSRSLDEVVKEVVVSSDKDNKYIKTTDVLMVYRIVLGRVHGPLESLFEPRKGTEEN